MRQRTFYAFFSFLLSITAHSERVCDSCNPNNCPHIIQVLQKKCKGGIIRDVCNCCFTCGVIENGPCDMEGVGTPMFGRCGHQMDCLPNKKSPQGRCVCTEHRPVCGSNGRTYRNICAFREKTTGTEIITLKKSPCEAGPKIIKAPAETIEVREGESVSLRCSASGFPLPFISWSLSRPDGAVYSVSSEDFRKSLDEDEEGVIHPVLTAWLALEDVDEKDGGVYNCVARNQLGDDAASADLKIISNLANGR